MRHIRRLNGQQVEVLNHEQEKSQDDLPWLYPTLQSQQHYLHESQRDQEEL